MTTTHLTQTRRQFLSTLALTTAGACVAHHGWAQTVTGLDPRAAELVAKTIGIDTHNHIDVPLTADEQPGPDIDLTGELKRSGLSAICMTFATDYQRGEAWQRFQLGLDAMDRQLQRNGLSRAFSASEVRGAHQHDQPTVIQAVEGAHFLQGKLDRVEAAYKRGLRHFGLLHDSDASVPLGDVYTNPPREGLTPFGADTIRECNRLGILIDLAHCDLATTKAALKLSKKPVVFSHTGLDTRLGSDPKMAQMMRPRLLSADQCRMIADHGGLVGVWTHLADTPLEYAQNLRAMVEVIGIDHVCIGTDTKLTPPTPRRPDPNNSNAAPADGPNGKRPDGPPPNNFRPGQKHERIGERTNEAWADQTAGFYYVVVDAMLKAGFNSDEIGRIGGGNYLRVFGHAVKK